MQTDQFQLPSPARRRFDRVADKAMAAAARALGLLPSQLEQHLDAGHSVTHVASERGIGLASVTSKMKNAIHRAWPRAAADQVRWLLVRLVSHRRATVI